jgi:hypothetical protein
VNVRNRVSRRLPGSKAAKPWLHTAIIPQRASTRRILIVLRELFLQGGIFAFVYLEKTGYLVLRRL